MKLYTMHDRATNTYSPPMAFATDAVAVRELQDAMQDTNSTFRKHPDDYTLWRVGEWDSEYGTVVNNMGEKLEMVIKIATLMEPKA